MTCQWLCQRMRLVTLAAIAWFITRCWVVAASGRSTTSTPAMPSSIGQAVANSSSGRELLTSTTSRPMNTGISSSSNATTKPMANSAMNRPFACRMKCQ